MFKKKPSAQLDNTDIESISLQNITLMFDVRINNPYPVSIKLDSVSSKFTIEGNQLFETATKDKLKIKANGSANNVFHVTLKYSDIINIVKDYSKKDNLNCVVSGDIILAVPNTGIPGIPSSYTFPYKVEKQIPAIKPKVSVKNFTIAKPNKTEITRAIKSSAKNLNFFDVIKVIDKLLVGNYNEAFKVIKPEDLDLKFDINFDIELKNDTKSKISFDHLNYDFFLNNDKMVAGNTKDIKTIANTTILRVKNTVSLKTFSKSIVKALESKTGDFHFTGETAIKLPDVIKKEPLKLLFNEKGSLKVATK
jgi:LEA14-like dessication related protein